MDEFDFIARYLAPLASKEAGALGLKDDAAEGSKLTKDAPYNSPA